MSEKMTDNRDKKPPPINAARGYADHKCTTCGDKHAPFGIGVYPLAGQGGQWFCRKCYPKKGVK